MPTPMPLTFPLERRKVHSEYHNTWLPLAISDGMIPPTLRSNIDSTTVANTLIQYRLKVTDSVCSS